MLGLMQLVTSSHPPTTMVFAHHAVYWPARVWQLNNSNNNNNKNNNNNANNNNKNMNNNNNNNNNKIIIIIMSLDIETTSIWVEWVCLKQVDYIINKFQVF